VDALQPRLWLEAVRQVSAGSAVVWSVMAPRLWRLYEERLRPTPWVSGLLPRAQYLWKGQQRGWTPHTQARRWFGWAGTSAAWPAGRSRGRLVEALEVEGLPDSARIL